MMALSLCMAGCGGDRAREGTNDMANKDNALSNLMVSQFEVTSDDLHDGVWDTVITNTSYGDNMSPAISWKPVDGAECYVIYMVDPSAHNWMHWKSNDVTDTELERGWASEDEYVGPYPPSGTHDYDIYVIALKHSVDAIGGTFNSSNADFKGIVKAIDKPEGNIMAYGYLSGTYTHGNR